MKIVFSAWGSTGDVYPLLAVAERLLERGHHVRVCAPALYRERIEQLGTEYHEVRVSFEMAEFHKAMDTIINIRDPLQHVRIIAEEGILRHGKKWYDDCLPAMKGYDIAICHAVDLPAQEAAIRNGVPWMTVTYCHGFIKSRYTAPYPFPNWGTAFNAVVWKLVEHRVGRVINPIFNEFIATVGGKPRKSVAFDGKYSPYLNLIAVSPTFCAKTDFPENCKITGAWDLDEPAYTSLPELRDFLQNGTPPIIISFGSMGGTNARETTEILIKAVRLVQRRAIIQAGWGRLGMADNLPDIFFTDYVPHRWLLPQACCVVHHGGAGTTTAVCRAKVPSVVVPHHADQPYWGRLLHELGVAPRSLPRRKMNANRLAKRIQNVLKTPAMTQRAQALGQQMEAEDGITTAVELIESFDRNAKARAVRRGVPILGFDAL